MVNLPDHPFRISPADDEHPLVAEALRSRRHFEMCWCGSGRKFKKCHMLREQEAAMTLGQALHEQERVFWKVRGCMHPRASRATCQGKVIDSHTIQRMGPLKRIIGDNNHVCQLRPVPRSGVELKEVGWRQASVFPGYCGKHDSEIFEPLEQVPFSGTHEQCVLQAYRSICNELYKKRALIESMEFQRNIIDRGCDLAGQIDRQLSVWQNIKGQSKSREENEKYWSKFDDAITNHRYDCFSSKCYFFKGDLGVTSSGTLHAEYDFKGLKFYDMWDLSVDAELLTHSIMSTDEGGAIVFTWLREEQRPASVVKSFDEVPDGDKGDVFVQYCFLNCENTYFSQSWWDQLNSGHQQQLKRYAPALFYDGGAFVPNHTPLVDWKFGQ